MKQILSREGAIEHQYSTFECTAARTIELDSSRYILEYSVEDLDY